MKESFRKMNAAEILSEQRRNLTLIGALPHDLEPTNESAGYRLQERVNRILEGSLGPVVGHKIGCTTSVMQRFLGIPTPCAGEIFARTVLKGHGRVPRQGFRKIGIECEIVERIETGDHLFFVGLILSAQAHTAIYDGKSFLPKSETTPLHFLGGHNYSTLYESFVARTPGGSDAPEEALQSMLEDDLELSREMQERKEEELGKIAKELEKGNVIDTKTLESELGIDLGSIDSLDLSKGIVLDDSNS